MYSEFVGYYNAYNKKPKTEDKTKKRSFQSSHQNSMEKAYESIITLSKEEIIYMREFDDNLCFLVHILGDYIENKTLLNINLGTLKKYIVTLFGSAINEK